MRIAQGVFPDGAQGWVEPGAVAGLEVPVLVVWGAEDRIVPVAHAEAAAGATVSFETAVGLRLPQSTVPRKRALANAHRSRVDCLSRIFHSRIIPDAGHMVQMEAAPRVNSLITAHVAGASG